MTASGAHALPDPPYPAELVADLHAGVLSDEVSAHMYTQIEHDPAARDVLRALDETTRDLASVPLELADVPPAVRSSTSATLAELERPRRAFSTGRILLAAAAVLLLAFAATAMILRLGADDAPSPAADSSIQTPTHPLSGAQRVSALAVLGRRDGAPFTSLQALRRCTAANDVPATTAVVGSGPLLVGNTQAAVILLSTGVAGRFEALVVGVGCDTGNPATLSRGEIGSR